MPYCEAPTIENSLTEGRVTAGTQIKVTCLAGYAVIGPELITCQKDREYSARPTCQPMGKLTE